MEGYTLGGFYKQMFNVVLSLASGAGHRTTPLRRGGGAFRSPNLGVTAPVLLIAIGCAKLN
jgi:hypothetical protein